MAGYVMSPSRPCTQIEPVLTAKISFVFRENRVPYYQRLFQRHDGLRQWHKVRPDNLQESSGLVVITYARRDMGLITC
jgi:hypothetical protein